MTTIYLTPIVVPCTHDKTEEQHDDTFDTIMGVLILTRARTLTVCSGCGVTLADEPHVSPEETPRG